MKLGKLEIAIFITCFLIIIISPSGLNQQPVALATSNSPYEGTGNAIDVHEFARNVSSTQSGINGTSFTFYSSWFPVAYRGYRLQSNVSDLIRFTDPLPNGSFENTSDFTSTWNLTNSHPSSPLIQSISPTTSYSPTDGSYCMDVALPFAKRNGQRSAYIDNDFNYTSEIFPYYSTVSFDIKLEDISDKEWLILRIAIWNQGSEKGHWEYDLKTLKADINEGQWVTQEFPTSPITGQVRLRISLTKITSKNEDVKGHILFDNFRYIIGSYVKPEEVGLTMNGQPFVDSPSNPSGSVNIYSDSSAREEVIWANCWTSDQTFQITSSQFDNLTFSYEYAMYVKHIETHGASTFFSAPVDATPSWRASYTVSTGAPSGHEGYSFGLFLGTGWVRIEVNNTLGQSLSHSYNVTSNFIKLDDGVPNIGETYSVYASAQNFVLSVHPQKSPSPAGPWENVSAGGYYVKDDYFRVLAQLHPIGSTNNYANVSVFFSNGTLWQSAESPTDVVINDTTDSLTSKSWQIPRIGDADIGQSWTVTVSFDNQDQCGMRQTSFSVVVGTQVNKQTPSDGTRVIWGQQVLVNVTVQNSDTLSFVPDGTARVRYIDRNLQVQYVSMVANNMGGYSTNLPTTLMTPSPNTEFAVEFFRHGYMNASHEEGTAIHYSINLINDLNTEAIKPSQVTGPDEYTAETSSLQGYTIQVKFYDPYQSAYVLNETSFWPTVLVVYDYYEDTGSGFGSILSSGSFSQNASTRIFYKHDPSYSGSIVRVKYEVTMRVEDASWNFEQQNFTILINIVSWATDLDALQTLITFPPTGNGWITFDQASDDYEAHVYWNEMFNITVFYENTSTLLGISSATVQVRIGSSTYSLFEGQPGYYTKLVNTTSLETGMTVLYVNATYPAHASQTIQIRLNVELRSTNLQNNQTGLTFELAWGDDFPILFSFSDNVDFASPQPLDSALVTITGYVESHYSIQNNGDGTYTVTLTGDVTEGIYVVRFNFNQTNYAIGSITFTIIVRFRHSQSTGFPDTVSVPWGDDVVITLHLNDTDANFQGISGATITFTWFDNILGTDYWFSDNGDGTYTITLNTTKVPAGTQGFTLLFQLNKTHYDFTQTTVIFQVRDIEAILYNLGTLEPYGTSVPWGDSLTIILQFNDTDHENYIIQDASITCNWDFFYWGVTFNTTYNAYLLRIDTSSRVEGSYTIQISAELSHYQTGFNVQAFVLRTIQTSGSVTPSYIPAHPLGDNLTLTITYQDLDHGGILIPFATVTNDWNATFYTIYDYSNGTYTIELNTTCRVRGSHQIIITLDLPPHYAPITLPVTLILERTPLTVTIIDPAGAQTSVEYGASVLLTVSVTNHHGLPVSDISTTFRWGGHNPVTMTYLGVGTYTFTFFANETPTSYIITIEATNETKYQLGIGTVLLFIQPTGTDLTVLTPVVTAIIGSSFEISVNFTTILGSPIDSANVTFAWANQTGILFQVAPGIYNATIDTTGFSSGQYNMYISASKPTMLEQFQTLSVILSVIPTALQTPTPVFNLYWGTPFTVLIYFNDTYNNLPIDGADIQYSWANQTGSMTPTGTAGWYNITLSSKLYSADSFYTLTLTADYPGYQYAITSITVNILPQPTTLALNQSESYYPPADITTPLNGTSWTIPWADILILYFNYTDSYGLSIPNATAVYNWGFGTGTLEYSGELYIAQIDLTGVTPGIYQLTITISKQNYEPARSPPYELTITRFQTEITFLERPTTVSTGTPFQITLLITDSYHQLPVTEANVSISIYTLGIHHWPMINHHDGTYSISLSIPSQGAHEILIHVEVDERFSLNEKPILVLAQLNPVVQNTIQWGAIIAVIGIIILAIWLAYIRVFSIPWMVRKMRKMSKSIGKGQTPSLSKLELARISSRPDQLQDIASPAYRRVGITARSVVLPTEIDWREREAEDNAIWSEVKSLPLIEYEQKLELFQKMKQISPSERVWFVEDLKKQMADGTRFARKAKEPEISEDLETLLQARLALFPALSESEKTRIAAQLRKMPKEDWDEIFDTLAISQVSTGEPASEQLRPDEFPSLSKEEREKFLEDIKDLTEEERQKVLRTIREKQDESVPEGKRVKGKKDFVIDEEDKQ